ncbi:MAG: metal-dependent hydrolase [Anaerolineae bacterium]|nr:metal-dependent hydrolase [Anaerolineae bacterium]
MTQIGHALTGAAIGVLCKPDHTPSRWLAAYLGVFLLLSNIPDLPFKHWGHDRYDISHSLFVNLLLIAVTVMALLPLKAFRSQIGGWKTIGGGSAAWLSHLLLDSFYNHGYGVAIFWPFSDARLALPMPWFSVVTKPAYFTVEGFREYLTEFAFYSLLLIATLIIRRARATNNSQTGGTRP